MKGFFIKVYEFARKNACYISIAISLLAFLIPIQITNESTILGIDMVLFYKTNGWWSIGAPVAFIIALACLAYTIYYLFVAIVVHKREKKGAKPQLKHKKEIVVFGFRFAVFYLLLGVAINLMCWSGYNPRTFAFIPFILQAPLYFIYRKHKSDYEE